jgi:hypothetical protein
LLEILPEIERMTQEYIEKMEDKYLENFNE